MRSVRVFISSTFRDMREERDELVKRVFPALRRRCEARGIGWAEVDLRWGVTDEARAEGRVLPICLEEIRRCRPFFVGLLGERYGWVPDDVDPALIARAPWLAEQRGRSVTELEILHGVLNDPSMAPYAYFYFRDPDFISRLPAAEQPAYYEQPTAEERARFGPVVADDRAADRRDRLRRLRERIRSEPVALRENYRDARMLGEWVLADLEEAIARRFPDEQTVDPFRAASEEHRWFAAARSEGTVDRPEVTARLDRHLVDQQAPLVIVAPPGSGKTVLLASWVCHLRADRPDLTIFEHYPSAAADGADWQAAARRLAAELLWTPADQARVAASGLDDTVDVRNVLPRAPDQLREVVRAAVGSRDSPAVVVIDDVDAFRDGSGLPALDWLPESSPLARLVVAACPGPAEEQLRSRGWQIWSLPPLEREERVRVITSGLARHGKTLETSRVRRIAAAPPCAQPMFLGTLIDELRLHGEHETLDVAIGDSLGCASAEALYGKMLARCERDYDGDRPGLTREALSLVWASRRGIGESELLDLLGAPGTPLPRAQWAPLRHVLAPAFVEWRGRIGFLHDDLRRAVEHRYLSSEGERRAVRLRLAGYFIGLGWQTRSIFEAPWQLARAGEWGRLRQVLEDPAFLASAWHETQPAPHGDAALLSLLLPPPPGSEVSHADVLRHWADLEASSPHRLLEAYGPVRENPGAHRAAVLPLSRLLRATGPDDEAQPLRRWLIEWSGDAAVRGRALVDEAAALGRDGRWDEMLSRLDEADAIFRDLRDPHGLLACAGNRAIAHQSRGDLADAHAAQRECEDLARRLDNRHALVRALSNQAWIAAKQGDADAALARYERALAVATDAGDPRMRAMTLGNIGTLLMECRRPDAALARFTEQCGIAREIGDNTEVNRALEARVQALYELGSTAAAIETLEEQCRVAERLGRADILYSAERRRAELLLTLNRLNDALTAARSARRVADRAGRAAECREMDRIIRAITGQRG